MWKDFGDIDNTSNTSTLFKKILDSTKRTDPQIALANLGGTVTQEDYNEINKYTKFTKETYRLHQY